MLGIERCVLCCFGQEESHKLFMSPGYDIKMPESQKSIGLIANDCQTMWFPFSAFYWLMEYLFASSDVTSWLW